MSATLPKQSFQYGPHCTLPSLKKHTIPASDKKCSLWKYLSGSILNISEICFFAKEVGTQKSWDFLIKKKAFYLKTNQLIIEIIIIW